MSEYTEADEADLLEQATPILPSDDGDPDEEYPNELEQEPDFEEPDEPDELEVDEPEDPGISEG